MKVCSICKEEKRLDGFSPNKNSKDNLQSHCKKCHLKIGKLWRDKNRERLKIVYREKAKMRRKKNPEKAKEIARKCYQKNRVVFLKRKRDSLLKIKIFVPDKYLD